MRRLEVHPEVYEELEEARAWYEEHAVGLGDEFLSEVEGAISVIQRSPEAWPIYSHKTRRFFVHRFPFAVVYRNDEMKIRIVAITHQRRKPGYWKSRSFD